MWLDFHGVQVGDRMRKILELRCRDLRDDLGWPWPSCNDNHLGIHSASKLAIFLVRVNGPQLPLWCLYVSNCFFSWFGCRSDRDRENEDLCYSCTSRVFMTTQVFVSRCLINHERLRLLYMYALNNYCIVELCWQSNHQNVIDFCWFLHCVILWSYRFNDYCIAIGSLLFEINCVNITLTKLQFYCIWDHWYIVIFLYLFFVMALFICID